MMICRPLCDRTSISLITNVLMRTSVKIFILRVHRAVVIATTKVMPERLTSWLRAINFSSLHILVSMPPSPMVSAMSAIGALGAIVRVIISHRRSWSMMSSLLWTNSPSRIRLRPLEVPKASLRIQSHPETCVTRPNRISSELNRRVSHWIKTWRFNLSVIVWSSTMT